MQAPVVKQDQLRLAVRLDLLIRLSENLQELYTETQGMISEAGRCREDLRRDYYDLAYHGLRAEHFDLVHRVEDLESAQKEMSEDEKKEYHRLQSYQKDRQRQVEALDKVWRRLFSPVCEQNRPSFLSCPIGFSTFPSIIGKTSNGISFRSVAITHETLLSYQFAVPTPCEQKPFDLPW